jgi:hypothetical protein
MGNTMYGKLIGYSLYMPTGEKGRYRNAKCMQWVFLTQTAKCQRQKKR